MLSIGSLEPLENSVHFLDLPSAWTVPQVSSGMVLLCMHSALVPVPIVCSFALRGVAVSAVKRLGRSQSATGLSICGGSSLLLRSTTSSSADEEDQPSLSTPHSLTHKHTHTVVKRTSIGFYSRWVPLRTTKRRYVYSREHVQGPLFILCTRYSFAVL